MARNQKQHNKSWLDSLQQAAKRFDRSSRRVVNAIVTILTILTTISSILCMVMLVIRAGYNHTSISAHNIHMIVRITQWVFIINVIFNLAFRFETVRQQSRIIKWIVDIAVLVTMLPLLYPHPAHPWIPWLESILYSIKFQYIILAAYSIVTICNALIKAISRRTNPSLLMSGSFIVFIIVGALLLMLPKSTIHGISFVDSLFVSTSAVSITGLTPVDIPSTFTPLGILIIAILIQIGALGVMTFTSFFALFFSGSASIYSQLMLKDMIYSKNMTALIPTLLYILSFTLAIEAAGALMIFMSIHGSLGMDIQQEIIFSSFHSLSAFCNAGFSTLPDGMSNPMLLYGNIPIYWVMTLLIVAGSIGFPILVNFRDAIASKIASLYRRLSHHTNPDTPKRIHIFDMNTKVVITTFSILFIGGAALFFVLEQNNSLAGMSLWQRITQSVFNSATPRSAGFSSVNPAGFLNSTLLIIMFLMWVGGASQSTGGGIKVNTLAAIWLNIRSILTGSQRVTAYHRSISIGSIRRANAVVALSIISYTTLSFIILLLEPHLPTRDLLFETTSALFTVGSSLGVTAKLSASSKVILSIAMFIGRVGLISLLSGLAHRSNTNNVDFPSADIIIN